MVESPGDDPVKRVFSGMAERRMPQIVRQRDRFRQVLVQVQGLGDRPGNLRNFQGMGEPGPVVVASRRQKHLGFMLEAPERLRMDNPIAIVLKGGPERAFRLRSRSAFAPGTE